MTPVMLLTARLLFVFFLVINLHLNVFDQL